MQTSLDDLTTTKFEKNIKENSFTVFGMWENKIFSHFQLIA